MAYAHNNNASRCLIDLDKIIASGAFKNVYEGDYTEGKRAGEKCVSKQFKSGSVHEVDCFSEELRVIKRAQAILDNWYAAHVISRQNRILLNRPEMWEFEDGPQAGIKHLAEPFIDHFEKFNSNTGWAPILGDDGMHSFFQRHRCNQYCGRDWVKPVVVGRAVYPMREGTTMASDRD